MVASAEKMLLQKYISVELVDRLTDETIFRAVQCQVTRQSWSIMPKQLVVGTFTWTGTLLRNRVEVVVPAAIYM